MKALCRLATAACVFVIAIAVIAPPLAKRGTAQTTPFAGRTLRQIATIDLPGPPGRRFDYLTIDDDGRQLFSAHLAAGLLYVIDLRSNTVVGSVTDVPGVEGVAYIGEGRKVYTSNWYENKIGVVDLGQMKVVKKIPTEDKPDGIAYAAPFHKAYVSDERAKAVAVIDTREDRVITTLRFDSETGVPQYDPVARRVYVNLQDQNMLAVVDPSTDTVVGRYRVIGCQGNHGMAIDPERRRAFLSCEGNDVLTVFNLETNQVVARLPMAKGADVVQFDPGLGRIYVACGSGSISVFQMDDPDRFRKVEDVRVPRKVHSLVVDMRTHHVYAPAEEENSRPVAKMLVFEALPPDAIPFDAPGVELSHQGEDCTFETLLKRARLRDRRLARLAEVVHEADLRDGKYVREEARGIDVAVRALLAATSEDHQVLAQGMALFEGLYATTSRKGAS